MRATHPVREDLNLLDGQWYADEPHDDWAWMRREAPVYWDEDAGVWGIARYDDILAIEKDPATLLEPARPTSAHGRVPIDDRHGRPRPPPPAVAGQPRLHAETHR